MGLFTKKTAEEKKRTLQMLNRYIHVKGRLQAGLPIPQNMECEIIIEEGKFIFRSGGITFELYFDKITDICIKTDKEIQKQYV